MNTQVLKTNDALAYIQSSVLTHEPIYITGFRVSATIGSFVATRDMSSLNTTWYTSNLESAIVVENTALQMRVGIPSGLGTSTDNKIGEIYIIATYQNTEFLFALAQVIETGTTPVTYDSGVQYYFDLNFNMENSATVVPHVRYIQPSRNLGEIVTSVLPLTDSTLHLLDGSLLSGSGSYSSFVNYIKGLYTTSSTANYFVTESAWQASVSNYGVCGKFVYNSTNNTVRLPKITGFVESTISVSTLGNLTPAGLPNITGDFGGTLNSQVTPTATGAFSVTANNSGGESNGNYRYVGFDFDASRSSSIYGNSTTVQPQAIKTLYYIVVATGTSS